MARLTATILVLMTAALATAQSSRIQWINDARQAVATAQRVNRPIMAYVQASDHYCDEKVEREQKRAFLDERVQRHLKNFVPLKLMRARDRAILKDFGFSEVANMELSFISPTGEVLGRLGATAVAQPDSLAQKMSLVLQAFGQQIFERDVKPTLLNKDAKPAEIKRALGLVVEFQMTTADNDVAEQLKRERLDAGQRKAIYETLAVLSTKPAVDALLEAARGGDAVAAKTLEKCTPVAAAMMVADLKADAEPFDFLVYKAVTKICRIQKPKPEHFFKQAVPEAKAEEVKRVTEQAQEVAARWKAQYE